jgi:6-pyruvoyltetrahydropterin/6-carboxytetrahydropterin synthase
MPITYLTRRERFSSAHRLFKAELNDAENLELYGQCSHPNWHGHNHELYVTVKGEVNKITGYVLNLKTLGKLIQEKIIKKIDHRNLNLDVDFMNGLQTSTENLSIAIWNELDEPIRQLGAKLHRIRVQETENNYVDYYGDIE